MGDPKLQKKKYSKPAHPWQKERILDEIEIVKSYGLKNKKEIWKANSLARSFAKQAKRLITATGTQAENEKSQLFSRIYSLGIVKENPTLDDVLGITLKNILNRRLQTIVFQKKLSRSMKQARQFIIHEHILVGNKKINSPSYLVSRDEELLVCFDPKSNLSNTEHPERTELKKDPEKKPREHRKKEFRRQGQDRQQRKFVRREAPRQYKGTKKEAVVKSK